MPDPAAQPPHPATRHTRLRLAVGYAAIAGTIPYLTLKVAWLTGSTIGIRDAELASDGSLTVLNWVTAGMDFVVILVALAFTHRFGERLPASLVLVPMWIGTGLLMPIAATVLLVAVSGLFSSASLASPDGPLEPWVQPMVYGGFAWQAVMLTAAFVLYARTRWPAAFRPIDTRAARTAVARAVLPLAHGSALLALLTGSVYALWAAGGSLGLSPQVLASRNLESQLVYGVHAVMSLAAAVGIVMMVHRIGPRRPSWLALAATWVGAGSMFAWGLWIVVNVLGGTVFTSGARDMAFVHLHSLATMLAGLLVGVTALMVLAERVASAPSTAGSTT